MKKLILIIILCTAAVCAHAQTEAFGLMRKFTGTTTFGAAIPLGSGVKTAFEWQIIGHYNPTEHWSVGVGTGISLYEKPLLPLFADVRYYIGRPKRFNAFLIMSGGYSFSFSGRANGGMFLNPAVGVQYRLPKGLALRLSAGWEMQKLERLKTQADSYFYKEFAEKLNHNMISVRLGLCF